MPARRKRLLAALALAALAALTALLLAQGPLAGDEPEEPAPAPQAEEPAEPAEAPDVEVSEDLGFPAIATKNTTRAGGDEPAATAAAVALAVYPSAGAAPAPQAVTFVGEEDWAGATAAAVLFADPVGAPLLVATDGELDEPAEAALEAFDPQGAPATGGAAAFAIGSAPAPVEGETTRLEGANPSELAAAIARLRARLAGGPPRHVVVAAQDEPAYATPAAAWAARSGDPVLFAQRRRLPRATAQALRRFEDARVYVLGPPSVIAPAVLRDIARIAGPVRRVGADDPVANAIAFARYLDGDFGWNINDPGHGFVVARSDAPVAAAAAAPLSGSGTWGPLLLTDSAAALPGALRGFLLDVKPGYQADPTRAVYNHVWVIGDEEAIDVNQQATLDELAEVVPIDAGRNRPPEPEERPRDRPRDRAPRDDGEQEQDRSGGNARPGGAQGSDGT